MPYILADGRRSVKNGVGADGRAWDFESDSNLIIRMDRPINKIQAVSLKYAEINCLPNILEDWNNYVLFYDNGSTASAVTATATQGYYTPDEFISMLNDIMTTAGTSTFTSTYDANTNKYTIDSTTNSRFLSEAEAYALAVAGTITFPQYYRYLRFTYFIGYSTNDPSSIGTSTTMAYQTDVRGVRYFTILFEIEGYGNFDITGSNRSFSFIVPKNNDELLGITKLKEQSDFMVFNHINDANGNNIHVHLYPEDSFSNDLNLERGSYFVFEAAVNKSSNMR